MSGIVASCLKAGTYYGIKRVPGDTFTVPVENYLSLRNWARSGALIMVKKDTGWRRFPEQVVTVEYETGSTDYTVEPVIRRVDSLLFYGAIIARNEDLPAQDPGATSGTEFIIPADFFGNELGVNQWLNVFNTDGDNVIQVTYYTNQDEQVRGFLYAPWFDPATVDVPETDVRTWTTDGVGVLTDNPFPDFGTLGGVAFDPIEDPVDRTFAPYF